MILSSREHKFITTRYVRAIEFYWQHEEFRTEKNQQNADHQNHYNVYTSRHLFVCTYNQIEVN